MEMSFKWLFFLLYCQVPCLESNQKSMVELFCKNSYQILAANFFLQKNPPQMFNCVPKTSLLPVKKKETNYLI